MLRFLKNSLATVRQNKTPYVDYCSRGAWLENDETYLSKPPWSVIKDEPYVKIFMIVFLTTSMTPYENVVLY